MLPKAHLGKIPELRNKYYVAAHNVILLSAVIKCLIGVVILFT